MRLCPDGDDGKKSFPFLDSRMIILFSLLRPLDVESLVGGLELQAHLGEPAVGRRREDHG